MTESLGNLVKVKIRTRWPNEAADFTPWLALEENMSQLGDAIGLEWETERTEVAVGPYYRNPSAINLRYEIHFYRYFIKLSNSMNLC